MTENATMNVQTKLSLHGSSSSSSRHALTTLSISMKDENDSKLEYLVYASHGIINLATASTISDPHNPTTITNVQQTLRSSRKNKEAIITALTRIDSINIVTSEELYILAAGYSNGGISLWWYSPQNNKTANKTSEWKEIILLECASNESISSTTSSTNSITDISGIYHSHLRLFVLATATAHGLTIYQSPMQTLLQNSFTESNTPVPTDEYKVQHIAKCGSLASVLVTTRIIPYCFKLHDGHKDTTNVETLIFCGTALPRHNKVWVYSSISSSIKEPTSFLTHGNLIGHEDWITCLAWKPLLNSSISISSSSESIVEPDYFLASGSHDAKIRLWKFQPSTTSISVEENEDNEEEEDENDDDDDDDDDDEYHDDNGSDDDEILDTILEEEGEARLVLKHLINNSSIAISLEALLIGHEESITSLSWKPSTAYSSKEDDTDDLCIVSSSMDKAILLWSPDDAEEGIWIPSSRVGSAGGILGGSIGSSLLGYLNVTFWNTQSKDLMMVGVGFGGSIHFWKLVSSDVSSLTEEAKQDMVTSSIMGVDEEQVWEALPCLTGHFKGVSDLDWETVSGEYLLTVSYDQTCRVWSEVHVESNNGESIRWMEVGRPQVHGYDLNAITCMGGDGSVDGRSEPRYRFVSGADEKQLRAFDAPVMTLRLVHGLQNRNSTWEGEKEKLESNSRVERAYIPSLGLSNKGMLPTSEHNDESNGEVEIPTSNQGESNSIPPLPLERDLGVTTLWPEVRKLYGHESELVCLASTSLTKRSNGEILVASACKARDVENAAIRLWNVESGICVGVLKVSIIGSYNNVGKDFVLENHLTNIMFHFNEGRPSFNSCNIKLFCRWIVFGKLI